MEALRRIRTALACLALCLALGGCGGVSKELRRQAMEGMPPTPDLSQAPEELRQRVNAAGEAVRTGDDPVAGLATLSRLYHANGSLGEAIFCYNTLLRLQPSEPQWPYLLANIIAGYGRLEEALPLFERTISLAPDYLPARIRMGDALLKLNRLDDAANAYQGVLAKQADHPYALLGLARVAIARQDLAKARDLLLASNKASQGHVGYDLLVSVLAKLGDQAQADRLRGMYKTSGFFSDIPDPWLNSLVDDCYDPSQLITASGYAISSDNPQRAIALMQKAVLIDPDNAVAQFQLGDLLRQGGKIEEAVRHYKDATRIRPAFSEPWIRLVDVLKDQGRDDASETMLFKAIGSCPDSPALRLRLGDLRASRDQFQGAASAYEEAVKLQPNESPPRIRLATMYFKLNRVDDGIHELETALQVEAGNTDAIYLLAGIYIKSGNRASADRLMAQVRQQPRMKATDVKTLDDLYLKAFGQPAP